MSATVSSKDRLATMWIIRQHGSFVWQKERRKGG